MAKKNKQEEVHHIIENQVINLEINGTDDLQEIKQIQQNVLNLYKQRIGAEIEKILSSISPPDVVINIDHLEIEVEDVVFDTPADLERDFIPKFKKALEKEVRAKVQKMKQETASTTNQKQRFSKSAILEFFLKNGFYPSWASSDNGSVSDIFNNLMKTRAKDVAQKIFALGKDSNVRERLYQQFSQEDLELLFETMYGKNAASAKNQLEIIQKKLGKKSDKAVVSAAINFLLKGGTALTALEYDEREFTRSVIEDVQKRKIPADAKKKVRAGFEGSYQDAQILEYYLEHGAIPPWADVDSKKSFQDLFDVLLDQQLANLQRMIEQHANNSTFLKRLIFQFSTDKILQLIEPTPSDNIQFILNALEDFDFLTSSRENIPNTLSKTQIRTTVLSLVLEYFFLQKKNNFIKKTFLKSLIEELAFLAQTDYDTLVKESYKSVRRKKTDTVIRSTLEQLDEKLQEKVANERKELRNIQASYKSLERELDKLKKKQETSTLSTSELNQLQKQEQELKQLEKKMEELEDIDMPLDIELLLTQRQQLKNQLQLAQNEERNNLENRLEKTEKEFQELQGILSKEVENLIKDKAKLKEQLGTIVEKRIKRVNNRLSKYQRAIQHVLQHVKADQQNITLYLADINKALRGNISSEEKSQLRKERTKLQDELTKLTSYLEELTQQEINLEEAMKSAMAAVKGESEGVEIENSNVSKLDALIFMLQYGATPWWADNFPKQSIEELFLEFAGKNPQKLRSAFQLVGKYPIVWERMINQLSEKGIKTAINYLYPNATKTIFAQADLLFTIHYSQGFPQLNNVELKKFQWASILEYLLGSAQGFNEQHFTKEITLQTARLNNISPSKLIEYTNNIIKNRGGDFVPFLEWNNSLAKDKKVAELDRELLAFQQEKIQKEQGIYLDNRQKLELLTEFLSSGKISDKAKEHKYGSISLMEDLLLEQIQKNNAETKYIVYNLMRLSTSRALIIGELSEDIFWEIVYLVRPKALQPLKRYFHDFKFLFDKNLAFEKDILFNYLLGQQEQFDVTDYFKALLLAHQQTSGRKLLLLLTEWKRKIKQLSPALRSSLLLMIQLMEVEALKMEQQSINDTSLRQNLQQQLESLAKDYTEATKEFTEILSKEATENQTFTDRNYKLSELEGLTEKLLSELEQLQKNVKKADALALITLNRKITQTETQLSQLQQKRPPLLRKLEQQIDRLKDNLVDLDKKLVEEEKKNIVLERLNKEEAFQLSLTEQQGDLLELIQKQAPTALQLLPSLLENLKDEQHSNYLYIKDLEKIAYTLKEDYRNKLLAILNKSMPSIISLEDLKLSKDADERQLLLLKNIDQLAPFQLWQQWDELDDYYKKNPTQYNPEKAALQQQIYNEIKRRDQKNLLGYAQVLITAQQKLGKELSTATSSTDLDELQESLTVLWKQQQEQVEEMQKLARDPKTTADFQRLRRNIDHIFTKLQNTRIQKSNAILTEDKDRLRQQKTEQAIQIEELEQKKAFLVDDIQREEAPKKQDSDAEEPKQKRQKQAPKPNMVKEPLQVFNAGMVLIWPYLGRLFTILKYVDGKKFVNIEAQYKAIHLLQYLVTGKTEAPENELLLNKIFCNFPITEPVPFGVKFDENELKMAEGLLQGVINNWPKMKTMSPNAFRGSFLVREGTIEEIPDKWILKVKKKPFDILLKTIPWGFSFIKLPWVDKFIAVEWQLL